MRHLHKEDLGLFCIVDCPGCGWGHHLPYKGGQYATDHPNQPSWEWNGDEEKPTISPSVLAHGWEEKMDPEVQKKYPWVKAKKDRCHFFLTDGVFQFLDDCEHHLAGQSVPFVSEGPPNQGDDFYCM